MERELDRHFECSSCKKDIAYYYTEVIGTSIYRIAMCADCPILQRKLSHCENAGSHNPTFTGKIGLCCGECGLTEEELRKGSPLGCSLCYEVFEELLVEELARVNHIPINQKSKKHILHVGRSPGQPTEMSPALKLSALHQALNDTLQKEDYEQAAWLRDQIKTLTQENVDG